MHKTFRRFCAESEVEGLDLGTSWLFEKPGTPVSAGTLAQADYVGGSRARAACSVAVAPSW
jgi:hypothetical protein